MARKRETIKEGTRRDGIHSGGMATCHQSTVTARFPQNVAGGSERNRGINI